MWRSKLSPFLPVALHFLVGRPIPPLPFPLTLHFFLYNKPSYWMDFGILFMIMRFRLHTHTHTCYAMAICIMYLQSCVCTSRTLPRDKVGRRWVTRCRSWCGGNLSGNGGWIGPCRIIDICPSRCKNDTKFLWFRASLARNSVRVCEAKKLVSFLLCDEHT